MKTLFISLLFFGSSAMACTSDLECSMGQQCIKFNGASMYDHGQCMQSGYSAPKPSFNKQCKYSDECPSGMTCTGMYGSVGICK